MTLPQASEVSSKEVAGFRYCMLVEMRYWISETNNDPIAVSLSIPGLGRGASTLHGIVRMKLQVPFHGGLRDTARETTIGTDVSTIYEALRGGAVIDHVMAEFRDAWYSEGQSLGPKL